MTLLQALLNSNGTMAQFNHRELGGGGQWMRGGMFDQGLNSKIDGLCSPLSQLLSPATFAPPVAGSQSQGSGQQGTAAGSGSLFVPEAFGRAFGQWWPAGAAPTGAPPGTRSAMRISTHCIDWLWS